MPYQSILCAMCGVSIWTNEPRRRMTCSFACKAELGLQRAAARLGDRFWAKVDRSGDCWEWMASTNDYGYGLFNFRGKCDRAHRVSWILMFGEIPDGQWVLHRCDNPPCVRPDHLFLGTPRENIQDMIAKGRQPTRHHAGERHPRTKLTNADVLEMRVRYDAGEPGVAIAASLRLPYSTVIQIVSRSSWKHLP